MTCPYCQRSGCKHLGPDDSQQRTAPKRSPASDLPPTLTATPLNLFALGDRRELVCCLCSHVIPNGIDQAFLRARHGQQHVRAGDAIEDRRGLPEGAVRYLVKSKATA